MLCSVVCDCALYIVVFRHILWYCALYIVCSYPHF
uniref:Uncharacterized protein n=1 Tax=Siphoviridae sp. ctr2f5 TaxID=2825684 RepID=A0A8S5QF51_9CAUD|nr:MAG TPA: hypothetical protein [Siphoviridae sp. ctr2f5]